MADVRRYTQVHGKETARIINRYGKEMDLTLNETNISVESELNKGSTFNVYLPSNPIE